MRRVLEVVFRAVKGVFEEARRALKEEHAISNSTTRMPSSQDHGVFHTSPVFFRF